MMDFIAISIAGEAQDPDSKPKLHVKILDFGLRFMGVPGVQGDAS
jgi:hypothetical protein